VAARGAAALQPSYYSLKTPKASAPGHSYLSLMLNDTFFGLEEKSSKLASSICVESGPYGMEYPRGW
jgi:hypothetical protein